MPSPHGLRLADDRAEERESIADHNPFGGKDHNRFPGERFNRKIL
jgi:hypothetical protein